MVTINELISEKEKWINDLKEANHELCIATSHYKQIQAKLWLDTDFEDVLCKSRPTVDEKKSYVTLHSLEHRNQRDLAQYNKEYILKMIELCDDKMMVCDE